MASNADRFGIAALWVAGGCAIAWAVLPGTGVTSKGDPVQPARVAVTQSETPSDSKVRRAGFNTSAGTESNIRQVSGGYTQTPAQPPQRDLEPRGGHSFGAPQPSFLPRQPAPQQIDVSRTVEAQRPVSILPWTHQNQPSSPTADPAKAEGISIMPRRKNYPTDSDSPRRYEYDANPSPISIMPRVGSTAASKLAIEQPFSIPPVQQTNPPQLIQDLSFSQLPSQNPVNAAAISIGHSSELRPQSILPKGQAIDKNTAEVGEVAEGQDFSVLPEGAAQSNSYVDDSDLSFSELPKRTSSDQPQHAPGIAGHSFRSADARLNRFAPVREEAGMMFLPPDISDEANAVADGSTTNDAAASPHYSVLPDRNAPSGDMTPPMSAGHSGMAIPTEPAAAPLIVANPNLTPSVSGAGPSQINPSLLWWEHQLGGALLTGRAPLSMSLQRALGLALTEAPELKVLESDWFIQQAEVERLDAAFDWATFAENIWNRDSNPVGSDLDGAANRLRSRTLSSRAGFRKLTRGGSEFELAQSFGTNSSNSQFINPNNQGTSRLAFEYERPLLQGAGEEFNSSAVRLAGISKEAAYDRLQVGIQDHLLEVASAYWALVLRRGQYLQSTRSLQRAQAIANEMATRVEVDVTPAMLDRARSEVAMRKSTSIESQHDIVRAQDALLRLIYGSRFTDFAHCELLPETLPMRQRTEVQPELQVEKALHERSEIHEAIREIKAASVRYDVAANQILPVLNMVLTGYVAGLRGQTDIGQAWLDQFQEGEPGVGIGFNFEIPYRNRAALAKAEQGQIAVRRMQAQLESTVGLVTEDVRNQVIQRNKFGAVLVQQWEALDRARSILKYTETRREMLADGVQVADLYLENLLQMQSRLEAAEFAYLQSQVRYSLADNALLRATSELDSIAVR